MLSCFVLWGIGIMLPWNVTINTFVFFEWEIPGYFDPAAVYPFAVNGLLSVSQIFTVFFGHKMTQKAKVQGMFNAAALIMFMLPLVTNAVRNTAAKFWVAFGLLFVYGPLYCIVQGTVFGLASILPPAYVGAVMVGGGLSGIISTLVGMLLIGALPGSSHLYAQALIFYIWATTVLLIAAAAYPSVVRSHFFRYYERLSRRRRANLRRNQAGDQV